MTDAINMIPQLLTALGALAALTSIITELTKNLGFLSRIPTDAQVIVTSLLLAAAAACAWAEATNTACTWYLAAATITLGLLAAFVAMYGWATFFDLLQRFDPAQGGDEHD
ncbi:MAG: hypothetical protein IJH45_03905 [Firmicutes bacterium]|nr:hypothetical protein [Bacillota bacterium]MBR0375042.1 hypothetical protein [Bacillota bacterium]